MKFEWGFRCDVELVQGGETEVEVEVFEIL